MARRRILAGIFLFSLSSLAYEIILTRIFSISLSYHFAFMVISISMLGIGASGSVLSVYPRLKVSSEYELVSRRIGLYGLLLGAGITFSYVVSNQIPFDPVRLSWDKIELVYICLYYLLLSVPFFFFGLSVSTVFTSLSSRTGFIYGSDLIGAGTGSITVLYLLSVIAPEYAVVLVSSISLTGAFVNGAKKTRFVCIVLILFNLSLFFVPGLISPRMSAYKGLRLALQFPGAESGRTYYSPFSRIDTFKSPAARFAPGLSLRYLDALPEQIGFSIDGGDINAITDAGSRQALRFLKYLPSALPYRVNRRKDVLILEPKGGLEVLLARQYGAENIYKVDSNPLVLKVVRDEFGDFSQGIYNNETWPGIGRSWLRVRDNKFDLIDIPLMGVASSGSFGIAEDYRFTVEAFKEYLGHLKDNGVLNIQLFILPPPRIEFRLLSTIVTAMEAMGIRETDKNIISIRSWGTIGILAKMSPFRPEEIKAVRNFSKEMRFDLLCLPGITEEETNIYVKMTSNEYFNAFRSILDLSTRKSFQRAYLFDIAPVHDESPFFHYYLKLGNVKKIYDVMGGKWQYFIEEGYLLPAVFVQVLVLSVVLILLPALSKDKKIKAEKKDHSILSLNLNPNLFYFAFLGLGFMFVEIPLIQKMILPLGNPPYAVATVLTSILIGSGAGSLLSTRFSIMRNRLIIVILLILVIAYSFFLPSTSDIISHSSIVSKIIYTFLFFTPLSLLMGIPFPLGIRNLGGTNAAAIPWAWTINGCLSVVAPIASVMLAMTVGFRGVLWIGAGAYLFAFLTFPEPE